MAALTMPFLTGVAQSGCATRMVPAKLEPAAARELSTRALVYRTRIDPAHHACTCADGATDPVRKRRRGMVWRGGRDVPSHGRQRSERRRLQHEDLHEQRSGRARCLVAGAHRRWLPGDPGQRASSDDDPEPTGATSPPSDRPRDGLLDLYSLISRIAPRRCAVIQASKDSYLPASRAHDLFGADSDVKRFMAVNARNHRFDSGKTAFAKRTSRRHSMGRASMTRRRVLINRI